MEFTPSLSLWDMLLLGGIGFLLFYCVFLTLSLKRLKRLSVAFYTGSDGKDLESTILKQLKRTRQIETDLRELANFSNRVYSLAGKGVYKVGLVRFNPFKDVGGNQSFALALLDSKKNGIVISSLYTREGTRIYAKPVQLGASLKGFSFTEEEQEAVSKANARKIDGFSPSVS